MRDASDFPKLAHYLATNDQRPLEEYLAAESHLPGPRGNLELAESFTCAIAARAADHVEALWRLCLDLAAIPAETAPCPMMR